jgi:hypothetical protein
MDECLICLNYNYEDNIIILDKCKCNITYHDDCIFEWLKYNNRCPYCSKEYDVVKISKQFLTIRYGLLLYLISITLLTTYKTIDLILKIIKVFTIFFYLFILVLISNILSNILVFFCKNISQSMLSTIIYVYLISITYTLITFQLDRFNILNRFFMICFYELF